MAKIKGLTLSESEVSQTVNLKDLFGVSLINQSALAQQIGQAMVDKILERTDDNRDINNRKFKPYSKEYRNSDEFKAFGKSSGDINMTLSGQMMDTLDVLRANGNTIKIGWSSREENAKAFNHNTGDTVRERKFFGLTNDDLQEIKLEFEDQIESGLQSPSKITVARLLEQLTSGDVDVSGGSS